MKLATIGTLALTVIPNQCLPLSLITQERKSISLYQPWLIKTNTFIYTHIYICTHSGIHIYYFFKMLYFCYILNTSESFSFPLVRRHRLSDQAENPWSALLAGRQMCRVLTQVLISVLRPLVHLLQRKCIPLGVYWTVSFLLSGRA